jgi:hypothetical protein
MAEDNSFLLALKILIGESEKIYENFIEDTATETRNTICSKSLPIY